jgi:hypothetical protein
MILDRNRHTKRSPHIIISEESPILSPSRTTTDHLPKKNNQEYLPDPSTSPEMTISPQINTERTTLTNSSYIRPSNGDDTRHNTAAKTKNQIRTNRHENPSTHTHWKSINTYTTLRDTSQAIWLQQRPERLRISLHYLIIKIYLSESLQLGFPYSHPTTLNGTKKQCPTFLHNSRRTTSNTSSTTVKPQEETTTLNRNKKKPKQKAPCPP